MTGGRGWMRDFEDRGFRSNCIIFALSVFVAALRHRPTPGSECWLCLRISRERGVPIHMGVAKHDPHTDRMDLLHFAPVGPKRRWWWPEWRFYGRIKRGDFPDTEVIQRLR